MQRAIQVVLDAGDLQFMLIITALFVGGAVVYLSISLILLGLIESRSRSRCSPDIQKASCTMRNWDVKLFAKATIGAIALSGAIYPVYLALNVGPRGPIRLMLAFTSLFGPFYLFVLTLSRLLGTDGFAREKDNGVVSKD